MGFVSEFFVRKESGSHSGTQVQYKLTMPGKGTHLEAIFMKAWLPEQGGNKSVVSDSSDSPVP